MEVSVRTRLAADVQAEGVAVIPGKLLLDIVRHLNEDTVSFELRDGTVAISSGQGEYVLNTYNPDDFPTLPKPQGQLFSVDRDSFVQTIQSVVKAASHDESRPVLTGIQIRLSSEQVTMVATDSYRLSVRQTNVDTTVADPLEAIVPARALEELVRVADSSLATSLAIGVEQNQILFGVDDAWVTARRIEGQFPDFTQLIPQTFEHTASADRAELIEVIQRTRLMAQRNSPLRLQFAGSNLTISASTQDVGAVTEVLPIEYDGEELTIGFNADFLRDGIQSIDDDVVQLRLISPLRPALIQGASESLRYLIMPVRLAD